MIALTGPKGSGKDTVADMIYRHYTQEWYTVTRIAFADPIKDMVQHIFDLNPHDTTQYDLFKRTTLNYQLPGYLSHTVEGRHVVREIGMLMRSYNEKQFTDYVESKFAQGFVSRRLFVVTDLRFDNEYTMLRKHNAKIVKVTRPDYHYDGHITERGFDDELVDFVIDNKGSLIELQSKVKDMMNKFNEGWK